ncbi:MAG: hypothetical protein ABFR50_02090 [Candidatus Fermentibacteria bacterium]
MKLVLVVLCVMVCLSVASSSDGMLDYVTSNPEYIETDDISVSFIQEWVLSTTGNALGIDVFDTGGLTYVIYSDATNDELGQLDVSTGTSGYFATLDPANGSCFGNAWDGDITSPLWLTSDWTDSENYNSYDLTTWFTTSDPSGAFGRGVAHNDGYFWTADYYGGCYAFVPGGASSNFSTPEVPTGISGIAAFDYSGTTLVVLTCYQTHSLWCYSFDGSTLTFQGSCALPGTIYRSYGLGFSDLRGTLFWLYAPVSGDYRIAELIFTFTSLQRSTWGELKTLFD